MIKYLLFLAILVSCGATPNNEQPVLTIPILSKELQVNLLSITYKVIDGDIYFDLNPNPEFTIDVSDEKETLQNKDTIEARIYTLSNLSKGQTISVAVYTYTEHLTKAKSVSLPVEKKDQLSSIKDFTLSKNKVFASSQLYQLLKEKIISGDIGVISDDMKTNPPNSNEEPTSSDIELISDDAKVNPPIYNEGLTSDDEKVSQPSGDKSEQKDNDEKKKQDPLEEQKSKAIPFLSTDDIQELAIAFQSWPTSMSSTAIEDIRDMDLENDLKKFIYKTFSNNLSPTIEEKDDPKNIREGIRDRSNINLPSLNQ